MKRIIAMCVVLAVAVTFGVSAYADRIGGINTNFEGDNTPIFKDTQKDLTANTDTLYIPLGKSAFTWNEGQMQDDTWLNQNLDVVASNTTGDDSRSLDKLFDTSFTYMKHTLSDQSTDNFVTLVMKPKRVDADTQYSYEIGVRYKQDENQSTPLSHRGKVSGTIKAVAADIIGYNANYGEPPTSADESVKLNRYTGSDNYPKNPASPADPIYFEGKDYLTFEIPSELFEYTAGTDKNLTMSFVSKNLQPYCSVEKEADDVSSGITTKLFQKNSTTFVVMLFPNKDAAPGNYVVDIGVRGTSGTTLPISDPKIFLGSVKFSVEGDYGDGDGDGDGEKLSGDITGYNSSYSVPAQKSISMSPYSSVWDAFPNSVYTYVSGTSAVTMSHVDNYAIKFLVTPKGATTASEYFYAAAALKDDGTGPYMVLASRDNVPVGTYELDVYTYGEKLGMKTLGNKLVQTYKVNVVMQEITNNKITGFNSKGKLGVTTSDGVWGQAAINGKTINAGDLEDLEITAGDVLSLQFKSDLFTWENGDPTPANWVSKSNINTAKITAKVTNGKNSKEIVKDAVIKYNSGQAYVEVTFTDTFASTKSKDFEATISLQMNKSVSRDIGVVISGSMSNEEVDVYDEDEGVELYNGIVAVAAESIKKIQFDLGEGVLLNTKLAKNKKVYGVASLEPDSDDDEKFEKYPDLEMVVNLTTIGLNGAGTTVELDMGEKFHVYNAFMEYLGTTDEKLEYSTKYYLSTKKLDIAATNDQVEEVNTPNQAPTLDQNTILADVGSTSPSNPNQNPSTGR